MVQPCTSCEAGERSVRRVNGRRYSGCSNNRCGANAVWRAAERREQARLRAAGRRRPARSPTTTQGKHPMATNPLVLLVGGAFFIAILALLLQH